MRSCTAIARREGKIGRGGVRVWINKLVDMVLSPEKKCCQYDYVQWEDFGIFILWHAGANGNKRRVKDW